MPSSNLITEARLLPYDPAVFRELLDFHIAREDLDQTNEALSELGGIICKYGFEDVVGMKLLHKHFDIHDHELLLRRFVSNREARTTPVPRDSAPENAVPYMWAFSDNSARDSGWYPVEFMEWPVGVCADLEILASAHGFLAELGQKISELDFQVKFGLIALYSSRGFVLGTNEITVENTDLQTRTLTLKATAEESASIDDATFTTWLYSRPIPPR